MATARQFFNRASGSRKLDASHLDYLLEPLEPRLLLSADPLSAAVEAAVYDQFQANHQSLDDGALERSLASVTENARVPGGPAVYPYSGPLDLTHVASVLAGGGSASLARPESPAAEQTLSRQEVIFIDSSVEDYESLLQGILQSAPDTEYRVVVLQSDADGLQQISDALEGYSGIDAIHLVSHGGAGGIQLGDTWLTAQSLATHQSALELWRGALDGEADLLIYGCDLAGSAAGVQLLEGLGQLTGADVAASDDRTGSADLGGDWDLEYTAGSVETTVAFSLATQQKWQGALAATFTVDTTDDTADALPGDGLAEDASGNTSLRAAIEEANALPGDDTINLAAGTYTLSMGDLDIGISSNITLSGAAAATTIIDAGGVDRIFDLGEFSTLTATDVTLQGGNISGNGNPGKGGAIFVYSDGTLNLERVILTGNTASDGGAIHSYSDITLTDVTISGNTATNSVAGAGHGGAINNFGNATLTDVTISGNNAIIAGGIYQNNSAGGLDLTNVTISGNMATAGTGGGLHLANSANLINVTISNNSATANGGGIFVTGSGSADLSNTIVANNGAGGSGNDISGQVTSIVTNIIEDAAGAVITGGFTSGDPNLDALASNGGFTQTHALLGGSIAINTGTNGVAPAIDQRGFSRPDGLSDIGAYEFGGVASTNYVVINTLANGAGSLEQAILNANANPGYDTITFNIAGGGPHVITVDADGLPLIDDAVFIDGWSEPDYLGAGVPVIRIESGGVAVDGLHLAAGSDGSTIRGLSITGFSVNPYQGIDIRSDGNLVVGNYLGLETDGTTVNANRVEIHIRGAANNQIGGTGTNQSNILAGGGTRGISLRDAGADGNIIINNDIGLDATGTVVGSGVHGIIVWNGADSNRIGGTGTDQGNQIAGFNRGITVDSNSTVTTNTSILGNLIWANSAFGIDLENDGITPNDPGDADGGSNDRLNFPELVSVAQNGPDIDVDFELDVPAGTYRIELFENPGGISPSFYGEGQVYLGAVSVVSAGTGAQAFSETLIGVTASSIAGIAATATADLGSGDFGPTSEFSLAYGAYSGLLWLSTNGSATDNNGAVGQASPFGFGQDIVSFNDPSLAYELGDGTTGTTDGTFSTEYSLDANVRAMHYVNTAVTVDTLVGGTPGTYDLQAGQIVVSLRALDTNDFTVPTLGIGNFITVNNTDVLVFTPSTGEYEFLLEDAIFKDDGSTPANIHAISIVEQTTVIGVDTTLSAGTYLIARSDPIVHADISTYNAAQGRLDLLFGVDFLSDSTRQIQGLELLEADLTLGSTTLNAGTILITAQVNGSQTVGSAGRTTASVEQTDVIALTVNATEQDSAVMDTNVDAQIFFDGSDISLTIAASKEINALTIAGNVLTGGNVAPTLTTLSSPVDSTAEDTEVEVSFADLQSAGNEADVDGTVDAFVVKSVASGTLTIGASAGTATAWAAGSNDTIDATNQAYWTPALDATGTLNAFAVVARDDGALESTPNVTAQISVAANNDAPTVSVPGSTFINEIHYDNIGMDSGEFVEIAGVAGNELKGWSLVMYSGIDGTVYDTVSLSGTIPNQDNNFGTLAFSFAVDGIQNAAPGNPDGLALVDQKGNVVQFLSYEGTFVATEGPANGMLSTDIGVFEDNTTTASGDSLQLNGSGPAFTWTAPDPDTFDAINTSQDFAALAAATNQTINEDASLVFSSGNGNAITVADVDAAESLATDPVSVTLNVSNGTLTLGSITGLGTVSGNATASVTFTGTIAELNAALEGLTYQPTMDYYGSDTLTVLVDDQGNSGSGGNLLANGAIYITVDPLNDDPANIGTFPVADPNMLESGTIDVDFSAIELQDADSGTNDIRVVLSTSNGGVLSASNGGGVTVSGAGTASLTLTGQLDDLNSFMDAAGEISFTPAAGVSGEDADSIDVIVNDDGNVGSGGGGDVALGTLDIDITPRIVTVTTSLDENDGDTTDILTLLATPGGTGISLREAIEATNNTLLGATPDQIILPSGDYVLGAGELAIGDDVVITGGGARTTTIDAELGSRVFHITGDTATITDLTITGGNGHGGGALVEAGATLNLNDVTMTGNTGDDGAAAHVHGTLNLDSVTLWGNTATGAGGALNFHGAEGGSLINVTISGNTAASQGGGLWTDSPITVTNSTIAFNTAPSGGGVYDNVGGGVTLKNSILHNPGSANSNTALTSGGSNIDSDGTAGLGDPLDGIDPLLNILSDYGGPTDTHSLQAASQAIDAAGVTGAPPNDQRGFARDGSADIGAFEILTVAPVLDLDADDSSGVPGNNFALVFTEGDIATAIADTDTTLVDADSTTFDYVTLEISGLLDGNAETFTLDGSTFALATAEPGRDTTGLNYHVVATNGAGTATITISKQGGGTFTTAETVALIEAIRYQHTDTDDPSDGDRLINVTVNDGISNSAAAITTIDVNPVNDAPTLTVLNSPVDSTAEDTEVEISFADLQSAGNEADVDGTVDAFVVKSVASGTLSIGASAGTASAWAAGSNDTVDGSNNAYWTPALDATGTLNAFAVVATDDGALESTPNVTAQISVSAVNDAPTFTTLSSPVDSTAEDTEVEISFADLQTAGNEADVDGTVDAFVVKSVASGTLTIGASAGTATAWAAGSNDTIDASNNAYWTPASAATGTLNAFAVVARDDGALESTPNVTAQINVAAGNIAPTFTALSSPVDSTAEDTEVEVSFADLQSAGNEADVDGTVDAFVVKSVASGTLTIGASAGTATAWAAGSNDTINATNQAYWTPGLDATGTLNAFAVVARDDGALESTPNVTAQISVSAVNDAPTFTILSSPVDSTAEDTEVEVSFADLQSAGNEADVDGTVDAFVVKSVASGTLTIGASAGTATAWAAGSNDTIDASNNAYWTPASAATGTLNAFAVVARDDGALESTPNVTAQINVAAGNIAPTFTALSSPVDSTAEDTEVEVSFADLQSAGNEADVDGTVDAFVVKSVASGTLTIGASAGTATAWAAGSNDTINATNQAYWTPGLDATGTLNAFAVVARDDGALESTPNVTAQISVSAVNDAPTFTILSSPVDSTAEDTEVEVSFADLQSAGNEADVDGTVDAFVVKSVASGTLTIGASAGTATAWAAGSNDTIDASNNAYWTPASAATGTLNAFAVVARDDGALESTPNVTAQINVAAGNIAPTFTALSSPVDSTAEDTEVEVSFADLQSAGNEADVDGTVDAFVVKSVASGTLRIGTSAGTATAWAAGSNDTVDASNQAYWTPDLDATGTLNAFAVVARDDGGLESTPNVTAQISVSAVNDAPTFTTLSSPVDSTAEDTEVEVSFADLQTAGNEADVDGTVDAFVVKSVASGTLTIGASAGTATAWAAGSNDTIDASNNAYWTPAAAATGTLNAFAVVARDNGGLESTPNVTAQINVAAGNIAPIFTALSSPVDSTAEDTEVEVSFADLQSAGNEADVDGIVNAFVVKSVTTGTLSIGASAGTATAWAAGSNDTIDASNNAYWTPASAATGTLNAFAVVARDNGALESTPNVTAQISVSAVNDAPTFTTLSSPVDNTAEDTEVEVSFADLQSAGDEADVDGTVDAFVVKSVASGTLTIGASASTATAWAAGSNDTINATNQAYWTPALDATGTLNAFAVVARDDGALESTPNVMAQISVSAVNDAPTFTTLSSPVDGTAEDTEVEVSFADLLSAGDEADVDGTVDAFVVKSISSGTLRIGASAGTATAWAAGSNDTVDAGNNAYWTPNADANGTLNAFAVVARDDGGLESSAAVDLRINVTPQNDEPVGSVLIDNVAPVEGDVLTASNTLSDADGISGTISYQWQRNGVDIAGATGASYNTVAQDTGNDIRVVASYIDGAENPEHVDSASVTPLEPPVNVILASEDLGLLDTLNTVNPDLGGPPVSVLDEFESESETGDSETAEAEEAVSVSEAISLDTAIDTTLAGGATPDHRVGNVSILDDEHLSRLASVFGDSSDLSSLVISVVTDRDRVITTLAQKLQMDSVNTSIDTIVDPLVFLGTQGFSDGLDTIRNALDNDIQKNQTVLAGSVTLTAGFSVGYVVWLLRSGALFGAAMSALPAWRFMDPLPILAYGNKSENEAEDEESLESIVADKADAEVAPTEEEPDDERERPQ